MDNLKFFLGIGLAVVIIFAASAVYTHIQKNTPDSSDRDVLYQVSTIDALLQGVFGGVQTVGELKHHGDFGIGTFHALDGEMTVLDGVVYQAKADGQIYTVADNQTTPFATVTYFSRDHSVTTGVPMNMTVFTSEMEKQLPSGNMIYAVRMHGTFPTIKVRSIPVQKKPYPTLPEAIKNQSVYTYVDTTGTIVGFYTPVFVKGINVPGYHIHYISDDHTKGGHILDLTVPSGTTVEYDITPGFAMALPTSGDFTGIDLSQDLSKELARVEK
ncbi:acetolactate decarboxylase [Methanoregula sp.]|uniref:acetolactate decarboxylase n=1 Tax=Methanoregula sp. TaxID=2052170 RepID=UPI00356410C1